MPAVDIFRFNTHAELRSAPINPGWITAGTPAARNRIVAGSTDRSAWTMLWDCTAGTFQWIYRVDETVHVLEGAVTVTVSGEARTLGPGDIAFFPAGTVAQWNVENYVRKLAFCQKPMPALVAMPVRLVRRVLAQLAKGMALVEGSLGEPMPQPATGQDSARENERMVPSRSRAR